MANESLPAEQSAGQSSWLPAALLIFLQLAGGMRELPQMAFFVIYLREQFNLPPVMISTVVAGAQVAGMLAALLGGLIAGRLGSKWVMLIGLLSSAIGSLALQAGSPWLAAGFWLFGGVGLALSSVGSGSYLTSISRSGGLGLLAAFYALSSTVGGSIGNPLAAFLIERYGYSAFSWFAIAVSATAFGVVAMFMPRVQTQATQPTSLRSLGRGMLGTARESNVQLITGLRTLPTIFYGVLMVLVPLLLNDLSGSKAVVAAYGTTNLIVASLAQLLAGRAADRWGALRPTLVAYGVLILAGLGLALGAGTVPGLFIFGVLGIAAAWALATLMYVWVSDGVAKPDHPATFGLLHAVWSLSMITGSVLAGWFAATLPGLPFLIGGLLNVGALFLISFYYRKIR